MPPKNELFIVSGLPRSGTSLMMQMLDEGGIEALTDSIRAADDDNLRGYYEFERVKKVREDQVWMPDARGKVVKMISQLLFDLPAGYDYRVIFMERDTEEMLISQEKMLERRGQKIAPRERIAAAYATHVERVREWLAQQPNFQVLYISYNELMASPRPHAERIAKFLGVPLDLDAMVAAIDPDLYRNRRGPV